jgi:hypothetical protein
LMCALAVRFCLQKERGACAPRLSFGARPAH